MTAPTYRGLPRLRMVRRTWGPGTSAIVLAHCRDCGCELERTASAVKMAQREGRGFQCVPCQKNARWARRKAL